MLTWRNPPCLASGRLRIRRASGIRSRFSDTYTQQVFVSTSALSLACVMPMTSLAHSDSELLRRWIFIFQAPINISPSIRLGVLVEINTWTIMHACGMRGQLLFAEFFFFDLASGLKAVRSFDLSSSSVCVFGHALTTYLSPAAFNSLRVVGFCPCDLHW